MKTKRKFTAIIASLAVALVLLVGMTMAYLTDQREVNNALGIGVGYDSSGNIVQAVQIDLTEPSFVAHADSGKVEYDVVYDEASSVIGQYLKSAQKTGLLPGDKIYKDPVVSNVGAESVYTRVKIDLTDAQIAKMGTDFGLAISDQFEKGTDGYYYYTKGTGACVEFASGEKVDFFTIKAGTGTDRYSMEIDPSWTNSDLKAFLGGDAEKILNMKIVAQAIQYREFTPTGLAWTGVSESDIQEVALGDRPVKPASSSTAP